jgi:hypothetical protein
MAANDMTYIIKHPYPDVPFNTVGGDTITALTALAAIFKKVQQDSSARSHRLPN